MSGLCDHKTLPWEVYVEFFMRLGVLLVAVEHSVFLLQVLGEGDFSLIYAIPFSFLMYALVLIAVHLSTYQSFEKVRDPSFFLF